LIYIEQKFKRCDLCGKTIPLRTKPLTLKMAGREVSFCSKWCLEYHKETRSQIADSKKVGKNEVLGKGASET